MGIVTSMFETLDEINNDFKKYDDNFDICNCKNIQCNLDTPKFDNLEKKIKNLEEHIKHIENRLNKVENINTNNKRIVTL